MSKVTVFVGLDYHQDAVQVCVMDRRGSVLANRRCANASGAVRAVVDRYGCQVRAAIEACCGAAELAEELIGRAGWSVDLAHPGYVARMKQSPDKTDFGDARVLADLERVGYLPRVWLAPFAIRELRRLVRFRQQLAGQRQADAGLIKAGNPQLRAVLIELAHRLARCDVRWARLAAGLRAAGKPGSVVAAAVANRWVRWLHHQMEAVQAA